MSRLFLPNTLGSELVFASPGRPKGGAILYRRRGPRYEKGSPPLSLSSIFRWRAKKFGRENFRGYKARAMRLHARGISSSPQLFAARSLHFVAGTSGHRSRGGAF